MSAELFFLPVQAVLYRGLPAGGARAMFYLAGTTTKTPVYTTDALTVEHTNPVVADALGTLPEIYLDSAISYRLVLTTRTGSVIADISPYAPGTFYGLRGLPGINGGVGSSAGFAALFSGTNGMAIGAGITRFRTSGYDTNGLGGADYIYDAAVSSAYVTAHPRAAFLAADGRGFRLDPAQRLTIEKFGGKASGIEPSGINWGVAHTAPDNLAAFNAYHNYAQLIYGTNFDYAVVPILHVNPGAYYFSDTIKVRAHVRIEGSQGGMDDHIAASSCFYFPPNKVGMIVHGRNTTDTGYTPVVIAGGGTGSQIRNIHFRGGGGTDQTKHGVWIRTQARFEYCTFEGFAGSGTYINASVTIYDDRFGNANECYIGHSIYRGNLGIAAAACIGNDANACLFLNNRCKDTHGVGFLDQSSFGNNYVNCVVDGSGVVRTGGRGKANHLGKNWVVIVGSTTAEPGTNNDWQVVKEGAVADANNPAWVAGTYTCALGALIEGNSNTSTWFGGYMEAGVFGAAHNSRANIHGGTGGWTPGSPWMQVAGYGNNSMSSASGTGGSHNWNFGSVGYGKFAVDEFNRFSSTSVGFAEGARWVTHRTAHASYPSYHDWYDDGDKVTRYGPAGAFAPYIEITQAGTAKAFGTGEAKPGAFAPTTFALGSPGSFSNATATAQRIVGMAAAAPASGAHAQGEIIFNLNPAAGGFVGWVCTASGTPGTWKTFGAISA